MSESEPAGQAEPAATSVASPAAPSPVTWPSARALVGNGLDLALRTTGQLRGASLVLALELLGVIGPLAILLVVIAEHQDVVAIDFVNASTSLLAPEDQSLVSILGFGILIGLFGVVAVVVEGRLIAAALLAGRFVGRPL
ncbi:MAG TPA: hypothetical protein VIV06_12570, partial [Candidatus Limnocylindrales bacterium]